MAHSAAYKLKVLARKRANQFYDKVVKGTKVIDTVHDHVHDGEHFFVTYSVADLGAATTPDDMMTVSFTTPSDARLHFVWVAICSSGARVRLIRGKTGGGVNPTGTLQIYNSDENSTNTSGVTDVAGANETKVSYDATLFTGGVTLIDEYIGADGQGRTFIGGDTRGDQEIILKESTIYQLSLYETDNVPGTLQLSWYEI